jgi:PII-like signaling protein
MSTKTCLLLFVNEADRVHHAEVVDHVMRRAMELGLSGATAFRAVEGFGEHLQLRRSTLLSLSDDEGIVIVAVDESARIAALLERLEADGVHALAVELAASTRHLRGSST